MVSTAVTVVNFLAGIILLNIPSYALDEHKTEFLLAVDFIVDVVLFFFAVFFCLAHFGVPEDSLGEFVHSDPVGFAFYFLMMSAIVCCSKVIFIFIMESTAQALAECGSTVPTWVYWLLTIAVFLPFNITSCWILADERNQAPPLLPQFIQRQRLPQQPVAPAG